jgi:hypothetical protein
MPVRSYVNLTTSDPGFNPERALTVTMNVSPRMDMTRVRFDAQGRPSFESSPGAVSSDRTGKGRPA